MKFCGYYKIGLFGVCVGGGVHFYTFEGFSEGQGTEWEYFFGVALILNIFGGYT